MLLTVFPMFVDLFKSQYSTEKNNRSVKIKAFISTHPLVHKHVKISVDEWIMETTRPTQPCPDS